MKNYCHTEKADWPQTPCLCVDQQLSGEYASHFGLELSWRNSSPLVGSSNRPTSHSTKGCWGWRFQSILELVESSVFWSNEYRGTNPEMNDMMILRDNFCTDCGQQGGLTSIPWGRFFDQQAAESWNWEFFFDKPENDGFLAKVYQDSEVKSCKSRFNFEVAWLAFCAKSFASNRQAFFFEQQFLSTTRLATIPVILMKRNSGKTVSNKKLPTMRSFCPSFSG